jgi:hypothetical protein
VQARVEFCPGDLQDGQGHSEVAYAEDEKIKHERRALYGGRCTLEVDVIKYIG